MQETSTSSPSLVIGGNSSASHQQSVRWEADLISPPCLDLKRLSSKLLDLTTLQARL